MSAIRLSRFPRTVALISFLVLISLTIVASPALAHGRVEVGPYVIVVGWEREPVIVGERNALVLEVTENDAPVENVEATLDVEVIFGPELYRGNLAPTSEPGVYSIEMLPTVRGQYTVRLVGTIGDLEVDELIEPEEVLPVGVLAFPVVPTDTAELASTIETLESQLQSARLLAIIGIALGGFGLILGIAGLILGSRTGKAASSSSPTM